ncbi:MAG: glycosyltransferase family 2 protein [Rhodospirillaceae bacterium]|nr:glycosyltransferase family 2 protein [Rhodospirillaceae bacterium]
MTASQQSPRAADAWVVVPAFNESAAIGGTLADLRRFFSSIVVVDDCSADDTAEIAARAGAHVCRHPVNLGQGAALQTGIDYALARGAEIVITFDADGQHRPEDALAMAEALTRGAADVVLSSRFLGDAPGMPALKRLVLVLAVAFTRLTTGLAVTDTHNGLRAFSRPAATAFRIRQNRMAHASEILAEIARLRLRWIELPAVVRYTDYSIAKGQRLVGATEILKDLLIRKLRS